MKCIAVDDEPLALKIIENFCNRIGGIELLTFSDVSLGIDAIKTQQADLIFLDIALGEVSGLQIVNDFIKSRNVIFTTAYPQYAVDGFELDAVDYLHKPFSFDRFKEAIDRGMRRILINNRFKPEERKHITIKHEYNNVPVNIDDILYVEAMENYSRIHLKTGKTILAHNSLKNIGLLLPADLFKRIHKSYIISLKDIKSYSRQNVKLNESTIIPVGRQFAAELIKMLS